MNRRAGFTLIELVIVVAVIAILATVAIVGARAAGRNANLSSAAHGLAIQIPFLRSSAMSEGRDYLLVFVDAPGSDASQCGWFASAACSKYFVLAAPTAAWSLAAFDQNAPGTNADFVSREVMPKGVHLDVASSFVPPAPFGGVVVHDADLIAPCAGSPSCFAIRFTQRGEVRPEYAGGLRPRKVGYAFVLGTDVRAETNAADRRGILVSFPGGIVKANAF